MKNNTRKHLGSKRQQGVVLIVALIMLLLITVLGVSAINVSRDKTQIAGNSMYTMLVYQGAESTLAKLTSSTNVGYYFKASSEALSKQYDVPETEIFDSGEVINGSSALISTASVRRVEVLSNDRCPEFNGEANSSETTCSYYEFTAETQLQATGARTIHSEGRAIPDAK